MTRGLLDTTVLVGVLLRHAPAQGWLRHQPAKPRVEDIHKRLSLLVGTTANEIDQPASGGRRAAPIGAGYRMPSKLGLTAGAAVTSDDREPYAAVTASISTPLR